MLRTYKAVLHGDRVAWSDDAPDLVAAGRPLEVHVTILDEALPPPAGQGRGPRMATALERLAASRALADIADPVAWQRETRAERELPGRDG